MDEPGGRRGSVRSRCGVFCPLRASVLPKGGAVLGLVCVFSGLYGEESRDESLLTQKSQIRHQAPQVELPLP